MLRRPTRYTRTDTLCPYTTRFRSRFVKSRLADFLQIDGVGLAQYVAALLGHLTRNTDGEAGAGERVPSDKGFRKAEFPAKLAHLVLEQFAQRLHQRHLHPLRQAADIVMALEDRKSTRLNSSH